jgi:hypothetical protein
MEYEYDHWSKETDVGKTEALQAVDIHIYQHMHIIDLLSHTSDHRDFSTKEYIIPIQYIMHNIKM